MSAKTIVKSKVKEPMTLESLFRDEPKVAVRWAMSSTDRNSGNWAVINPKAPEHVMIDITTQDSFLTNVLLGSVEVKEVTYSCGSKTQSTKKVGLCVGNISMTCPVVEGLRQVNLSFDGEKFYYVDTGGVTKELKKAVVVALHPRRYAVAYIKEKTMKKVN